MSEVTGAQRAFSSGRPKPYEKVVPSKFEKEVKKLGIDQDDWVTSKPLQKFAQKYRHTHYVPEFLLVAWGLQVYF